MDARVAEASAFIPAAPPRPAQPLPLRELFFGCASRNVVAGCPESWFREPHVSRRVLGRMYHVVSDPDLVRRILVERPEVYVRPRMFGRLMPIAAEGLFGASGETWRAQRRLMAPVFTPSAVADFLPTFADVADAVAVGWRTSGEEVIDVARAATQATFEVIGRCLFSGDPGLTGGEAAGHVRRLLAAAGRPRPGALIGAPWLDLAFFGSAAESEGVFRSRLADLVAKRQTDRTPPPDFLTRLIEAFSAEHPPGEAARLARANAVTFLIAGHETTANALAWCLYLLSEDAEAQAWAAEEAQAALSAAASPQAVLDRLVYLRWVLEEALRLYPPAPRLEREAAQDDQLGDLAIRQGHFVGVWPWVVHRHRRLWRDPDRFDPETFSPEAVHGRHRYQYIPFGAGPRVCIGAQFATAEALLILARWLAEFRFSPLPGRVVELASDVTLKPQGGLPLTVRLR